MGLSQNMAEILDVKVIFLHFVYWMITMKENIVERKHVASIGCLMNLKNNILWLVPLLFIHQYSQQIFLSTYCGGPKTPGSCCSEIS